MTARPRRSVLYMPGANVRALDKARGLPADALILDLEDAVAPDEKPKARENVRAALGQGGYGKREIFVRINALETPWGFADAELAAGSGRRRGAGAQGRERRAGAPGRQHPGAVRLAGHPARVGDDGDAAGSSGREIAQDPPALAGFVMPQRLVKDLRAAHTPYGGRSSPDSASRCSRRVRSGSPSDGVSTPRRREGFDASLLQAKAFGFDGKTLIHPKQGRPRQRGVRAHRG